MINSAFVTPMRNDLALKRLSIYKDERVDIPTNKHAYIPAVEQHMGEIDPGHCKGLGSELRARAPPDRALT